ncbi:hypothetical protein DM02DRAFT_675703 [Periconia macrospinosa]|uniref:Uncharacterized protein n=1 Tax=Periconia macrospinosa TaxID=97972 RepID=A0A2V1DAK4_9PLEO|nr:hypothetical protein DM02DRAFT_675703 [Periconia macrospinosa]
MDNTSRYSHRPGYFGNISSLALRSPPKSPPARTVAQQIQDRQPQPQHRPSIEKVAPPAPQIQTRESEGLIPVHAEEGTEVLFVVDCPSLHIVNGDEATFLAAHRGKAIDADLLEWDSFQICPACSGKQGIFHKARRLSSTSRDNQKGILPPLPSTETQTQVLQAPLPPTPVPSPQTEWDRPPQSRYSAAWLTHLSRSPSINAPIPLHPEGPPGLQLQPPPTRSDSASIRSKTSSVFSFSRFRRGSKMKPNCETLVGGKQGSSLPSSLNFAFSAVGTKLLLWGKNAGYVVRVEMATRRSEVLRVAVVDGEEGVSVKCVASGRERCVAVVSVKQKLFLASLHADPTLIQAPLQPLPQGLHPLCIAVSRDDRIAAVGLGPEIFLCEFGQGSQVWTNTLLVYGFVSKEEVRFQVLNFSAESTSLVVSTQKIDRGMRTSEDDSVVSYVWEFQRDATTYTMLQSCKMPTDRFGLTSISYAPTISVGLITGLTDSSYPLFLLPSSTTSHSSLHLNAKFSYKIRCAADAPYPSHSTFFLNSKNQIFKADLSKRTVRLWSDLSKERKGLDVREEGAVLACPDAKGEKVYAFWKVKEELRLVECVEGNGVVSKQNLRWLWDEVVQGLDEKGES